MYLKIEELLSYTDEEREKWRQWFAERGDETLKIALSGETHTSIGGLILHIFWAEMFYTFLVDGEVLTLESDFVKEHKDLPNDQAEPLFAFGRKGRERMWAFASAASEEDWERTIEAKTAGILLKGSARKLISHILVHEIRHWAQVAIMVRQSGRQPPGDHDLCFSPSFGPLILKI